MKVLLRRNIPKLGKIGEIVEVKPGFARNYLLPQHLAVQPTAANVKAVDAEKHRYLEELARQRTQLETQAALLQGKEITIPARANPEGHLYGSVGPAQISATLAAENVFLDPECIVLDTPIRQLDKYDVLVRFAEDVTATIHVWVVPVHDEPAAAESPTEQDASQDED